MKRAVLLLVLVVGGCWSARYLSQQGLGQLQLMRARRRVAEVLTDPSVDPDTKRRLRLATRARDFGVRALGLRGGDVYTRYVETAGAPIAWNVSAAPKDQLLPYLHRFPLVGAVPYLGFFHEEDARREQARLARDGLDTYLRPVAGYSTLGVTADPIFSSMLEGSDPQIVEVVLHEMTHATAFLPGRAEWNESLATFVGLRGAAGFFAGAGSEATARELADEAEQRERDEERFACFLDPITSDLKALYASPLERTEKLRRRELIFARARRQYLELFPPRPGKKPRALTNQPFNNAVILALAVYHHSTPEHRRIYAQVGGDLRRLVALYRRAVEDEPDPIAYLQSFMAPTLRVGTE